MHFPSLPGPRDVWQLLERSADSVEQLLAAVPRVLALVGEAERLLADVRAVVDRIEGTRASAQGVVDRTDVVVGRADALLATLVPLNERLDRLLDGLEPPLTRLQPVLERLADTTSPAEVDALVHLVDHLPLIADRLETDILPILDTMGSVAPDLHDLLDVSRELNEMLARVPGLNRIKDRVDRDQEAEGRG